MVRVRFLVFSVLTCLVVVCSPALAINLYCLPQAAVGAGTDVQLATQISMFNTAHDNGWVIVYFYDDLGQPWEVTVSCLEDPSLDGDRKNMSFTIPASGKYTIRMGPEGAPAVGWVKIWSEYPMQVSATYGFYQKLGGASFEPVWETAVLPAPPAQRLTFPAHRRQTDTVVGVDTNTAYSIVNPTPHEVKVTAKLYDSSHTLLDTQYISLPPMAHRAKFITELFTGASFGNFRGTVYLESDGPIAGLAMKEAKGMKAVVYSTLPVEPTSQFRVNKCYDNAANDLQEPMSIVAPSEVHGTIDADPDYYGVTLSAGQTLEVVLLAGSLGSTLDPYLQIRTIPSSSSLGTVSALFTGAHDRKATFTAGTGGLRVIKVSALNDSGGSSAFYRLFVRVHD